MKKFLVAGFSIIVIFIIGFFSYITLTTKDPLSEKEFQQTQKEAKETVIEYFQKEKQLDVVITEVGIVGEIGYKVWVEGHALNNEQEKFHVIVDVAKENNYKVISSNID
ncbi:hypothetical protein [Bacillus thuringiensis]|uniref:hypothetical protein n=1 Tax=Bacillus thuringiensis TaxID=1428 RepID=UPI000BECCE84|nr:hypothetical protein [Bacillus thuringiensis]PEB73353.1 hypothetical protein COM89_22640 [Bacillus thuringiensis]PFB85813.1 hypothetical protein CN283_17990 [Bacillus thuringiensis]PGL73968.1 hypothetical protein CN944_27970 [Bacillus thuringiensis]PGN37136.1 hypothetical protein CN968_22595 [Bacillus thuringiensis]PGT92940.1 hypothetical protein COD17_02530 [Bacillus thuringiensis]